MAGPPVWKDKHKKEMEQAMATTPKKTPAKKAAPFKDVPKKAAPAKVAPRRGARGR